MERLLDYITGEFNQNYHYVSDDITSTVNEFENIFKERCKYDGTRSEYFSKEIMDDMFIFTYRNEKDVVYIACTTMCHSDVFLDIELPITNFKTISNNGVMIYATDDKGVEYLLYRVYYKPNKDRLALREIGCLDTSLFLEKHGKYPADVYVNDDGTFTITSTETEIFIVDKEMNIIRDIFKEHPELLENRESKQYALFSGDLLLEYIHDKDKLNGDMDLIGDTILETNIYSISKDMMLLSKYGKSTYINRIFNPYPEDYFSKSFVFITKSTFELTKDMEERILNKDPNIMSEMQELVGKSYISYLYPLFQKDLNVEGIQVNQSANDYGDTLDGMEILYTIYPCTEEEKEKTGKELKYNFYKGTEKGIKHDVIYTSTLPKKIRANEKTGLISFSYEYDEMSSIVNYMFDQEQLLKYSTTVMSPKDASVDYLKELVGSLSDHFYDTNMCVQGIADDEMNRIINAKLDKINEEDTSSQVHINHYVEMISGEPYYNDIDSLSFGAEGRFVYETWSGNRAVFKIRERIQGSLDSILSEEKRILLEDLEYIKKLNPERF